MMVPNKLFGEEYYTIEKKLEICTRKILVIINGHRRYYRSFLKLDKCMVNFFHKLIHETVVTLWQFENASRTTEGATQAKSEYTRIKSYGKLVEVSLCEYKENDTCVEIYCDAMETLFDIVRMVRENHYLPRIGMESQYKNEN